MPGMRPDVVITRGNHELLVEVAVTHRCEALKLARLRERRFAAIEIDLSKVSRAASREAWESEVLETAPRGWLFNRHIDDLELQIRQRLAEQEAATRARQDQEWGQLASDLAVAMEQPRADDDESVLEPIRDAGLEECIGITIPGDECFVVSARVWQSAVIWRIVLGAGGPWDTCPPEQIVKGLITNGYLKDGLDIVSVQAHTEMKRYLAAVVPGFRPVLDVVNDYMAELVRLDLLHKGRTRWFAPTLKAQAARAERGRIGDIRKRCNALQEEVDAIKSAGSRGGEIDFRSWAKQPAEDYNDTPENIAIFGGQPFERLINHLRSLRRMLSPNAFLTTDGLLGLPLEDDLAARSCEQDERRRKREQQAQVAAQERQKTTRDFLVRLRDDAMFHLGDEAGARWLADNMPAQVEGLELRPEAKMRLREALEVVARPVRQAAQAAVAKAAADELSIRRRAELPSRPIRKRRRL